MITHMHIENFKCFTDFDIDLGRFTVLIGPNDTGKTAFLQAIRLLAAVGADRTMPDANRQAPWGKPWGRECIWRNSPNANVIFVVDGRFSDERPGARLTVRSTDGVTYDSSLSPAQGQQFDPGVGTERQGFDSLPSGHVEWWNSEVLGDVRYYGFIPRELRRPAALDAKMDETGSGFFTLLDDFLREDRRLFSEFEQEFYTRFPGYRNMVIEKDTRRANLLTLRLKTANNEDLSADSVSDGVILSLAFLAIAFAPRPPGVLLLEEPENGVHPAALKDIMKTLRGLSKDKGVQVVLTTHSPYLLDLVEPEDVRVFQKDSTGAVSARLLSEFADVDGMKKHLMTGEIWSVLSETEKI
jgi:predicted ATPase